MRTKKAMLLGVIVLLMVLLGACAAPAPTAPVTVVFADENLEAAIRDALGKPAGEAITPEMARLTALTFTNVLWGFKGLPGVAGYTKLSGIEYCTNLTWLDLTNSQTNDISPLASLTNLTVLNLHDNPISDISPLASLTNLTWLSVRNNQISDISPLASLTNLTWLSLRNNQISDISPLVENSGLGEGDYVLLKYNNLDLSEGSEDMENIRQLEGRGVLVHY